jgi:hypothetical protein
MELLASSPLFADARKGLLAEGVAAALSNGHVKAIHVLVPQIEDQGAGAGFLRNRVRHGIPSKENPKVARIILITAAHVFDGVSGDNATRFN